MAEPDKVYDDNNSETPVTRPDLRALEGAGDVASESKDHSNEDQREQGEEFEEPDDSSSPLPRSGLTAAEAGVNVAMTPVPGAGEIPIPYPEQSFNYRLEGGRFGKTKGQQKKTDAEKKKKRKKKLLILGGGSGFGIIGLLVLLMFIASSLKIQNLGQHLLEYNMLNVDRTFQNATDDMLAQKFAAEASTEADQSFTELLRSKLGDTFGEKYSDFRSATWGKFDSLRPQKIIENMQDEGQLKFIYQETPRKYLPGNRLELSQIEVNGDRIDIADLRTGHYFSNLDEKLRFSAELDNALEDALPSTANLIRSRVASSLRDELGINLSWWQKKAKDYEGLKQDAALKKQQQDTAEQTKKTEDSYLSANNETPDDAATPTLNEQGKEASDDLQNAIKDGSAPEEDINAVANIASSTATESQLEKFSTVLKSLRAAAQNAGKDSELLNAIEFASGYYKILLPLCMIYDGSVVQSKSTIDTKVAADQSAFYAVESAADQQKSGETNAEAVGAMNNKLGDISASVPEQRAYGGGPVDTSLYTNRPDFPEVGALGTTTSIINVFAGNNFLSNLVNQNMTTVCHVLLNIKTASAAVVLQILATVFSGGTDAPAEAGAEATVDAAVETIVEEAVSTSVAQAGEISASEQLPSLGDKLKDMLKQVGKDTLTAGGLTVLAKLIVLAKMGGNNTGLETGTTYANEADMGANVHANELDRTALAGRPLTAPERVASRVADQQDAAANLKQESITQRYFAMSNADSFLSRMGTDLLATWANFTSNRGNFISNAVSGLLHSGNVFTKFVPGHTLIAEAASASPVTDYNIIQEGWTAEELNLAKTPDYSPVLNAELWERYPNKDTIVSTYGPCFTDTMGVLLSKEYIRLDKNGQIIDGETGGSLGSPLKGQCSPSSLSFKNPKYGDWVFRYRLVMRNEFTLDHLNSVANNENTDSTSSTQSASTTATTTSSTNPGDPTGGPISSIGSDNTAPCPVGTDEGLQDGYLEGALTKVRICNVQDMHVNTRIAANLSNMLAASKGAGLTLTASSSFRTMSEQEYLYACFQSQKCNHGNTAARPGYSNHQMGLAVDFVCNGGKMSYGGPCNKWLDAHGETYSFYAKVAGEPWHWSLTGN